MASISSRQSNNGDNMSVISLGSTIADIQLPNGVHMTQSETMEKLRQILPCENLKYNMTVYKRCFKAVDAIKVFKKSFPNEIPSDEAAISFARNLQRARIITHVVDPTKAFSSGNFFFRLQCYQSPNILNSYRMNDQVFQGDPMELLDAIASLVRQLELEAIDAQTGLVDFRVAHKSRQYRVLEDTMVQLQSINLGSMDHLTRLAAVINIHNVMIKYAFIKVGVPDSKATRTQFFSEVKMNIGGDILSFDDLLQGILRANDSYFPPKDPRARLALSTKEPRIHFALKFSPLERLTPFIYPDTVHYDLAREAKAFLDKHTNFLVEPSQSTFHLSQVFKTYRADFETSDWRYLAHFLERNLVDGGKKLSLQQMIQAGKTPKIRYMDFDWGTNGDNFFAFNPSSIKAQEKGVLNLL